MLPSPPLPLLCGKTCTAATTLASYALGLRVWQNVIHVGVGNVVVGCSRAESEWCSCVLSIHRWRGGCSENGVYRVMAEIWVSVAQIVACYHVKSPVLNWMPTNFGFVGCQKRSQSMFWGECNAVASWFKRHECEAQEWRIKSASCCKLIHGRIGNFISTPKFAAAASRFT